MLIPQLSAARLLAAAFLLHLCISLVFQVKKNESATQHVSAPCHIPISMRPQLLFQSVVSLKSREKKEKIEVERAARLCTYQHCTDLSRLRAS